jgi:hypothetical protein
MSDVTPADVSSAMQMVGDCSPVQNWAAAPSSSHGEQEGSHQGSGSGWQPQPGSGQHGRSPRPGEGEQGHSGGEDHEVAVIQHLEHTETTTITENHISVTRIDASHSIWAGGDANVLFGDDNVLAEKGGVALDHVDHAGPISVDNSSASTTTTISDSNVAGRDQTVDQSHGNTSYQAGNGSQIGDNTDNSVHDSGNGNFSGNTADSGNTDNSINHSFDGNSFTDASDHSDHTTTVTDSGNGNFSGNSEQTDNSDHSDHSDNSTTVTDSGNGNFAGNSYDASTHQDDSTHIDDSLNGNAVGNSYEDDSTTFDHSLNGNEVGNSYEDNSTNLDHSLNGSLDHNAVAVDDSLANSGHVDLTPLG